MSVIRTHAGDYKATFKGVEAFGFTPVQAIMNCMILAFDEVITN